MPYTITKIGQGSCAKSCTSATFPAPPPSLAVGGASQTPGNYIELTNGILCDPALDTYKNKTGMQLTPQRFTYQPQDPTDYKWTPDIQLTTITPPTYKC